MQVAYYSNVLDKRAIDLVCEGLIATILKENSSRLLYTPDAADE